MMLFCAGCEGASKSTRVDFVVIEEYGNTAQEQNTESIQEALKEYCQAYKTEYSVFTITGNTAGKLRGALDLAKNAECGFVIVPAMFKDTVLTVAPEYPEMQFLLFDTYLEEHPETEVPQNVHALDFSYYEAGYTAGRTIPLNRCTTAGVLDDYHDERSVRFFEGLMEGLEETLGNSGKEFSLKYFNVSGKSANAINQVIYQTIVTSSDAILYTGEKLEPYIRQYAIRTGMKYIGLGTQYGEFTSFYIVLNYSKLFGSFMVNYQSGRISGANYTAGFPEGALSTRYGAALAPDAAAQLQETGNELVSGELILTPEIVPLEELTSEILTLEIEE